MRSYFSRSYPSSAAPLQNRNPPTPPSMALHRRRNPRPRRSLRTLPSSSSTAAAPPSNPPSAESSRRESHQLIAIETQAHGHTPDIDRPTSAEQDADDVVELLKIFTSKRPTSAASATARPTASRSPSATRSLWRKLVLLSPPWSAMASLPASSKVSKMPTWKKCSRLHLKQAYLQANPYCAGLQKMFDRDVARMLAFKDIPDTDIKTITVPAYHQRRQRSDQCRFLRSPSPAHSPTPRSPSSPAATVTTSAKSKPPTKPANSRRRQ